MKDDEIRGLLLQVAAGDTEAFQELYRVTSGLLFGVLTRMIGNRQSAEDGLQEVFLRVWTRAPSFEPERGTGMTWLIVIARNYAIDHRRRIGIKAVEHLDAADVIDPAPGALDAYAARAIMHRFRHCLQRLDPINADAVRSAYLDGQSYADLASRYSLPINTLRSRLRRSLIKLRDCMQEQSGDRPG